MPIYQVTSSVEATERQVLGPDGHSRQRARFEPYLRGQIVKLGGLAYGDISFLPKTAPSKQIVDGWNIEIGDMVKLLIHGAIVSHKYGFVFFGHNVLSESLIHAPFYLIPDSGYRSDKECELPAANVVASTRHAYHLLAGNLTNYYHWLFDVISRYSLDLNHWSPAEDAPQRRRPIVLVPADAPGFVLECLDLISSSDVPFLEVGADSAIFVDELEFLGTSLYPPPQLLNIFQTIRKKIIGQQPRAHRRLYITRQDSRHRRLLNEDDIIRAVTRFGFECVSLTEKSLVEQVSLFSEASHIIAPHGAGLANLVFCQPGTKICELNMDTYVNWVFRYLCACLHLPYGSIFGPAEVPHLDWPHDNTWTAPLKLVNALLNDHAFMS